MERPLNCEIKHSVAYQFEAIAHQQSNLFEPSVLNAESRITYDYPMSPPSNGSDKSTPTKQYYIPPQILNANKYSTLLSKDAERLKEIAESLTTQERFLPNTNAALGNIIPYDTRNLERFSNNIRQTVEEYINQVIPNEAKQYQLLKANQCNEEVPLNLTCNSVKFDVMPKDLSIKPKIMDNQSVDLSMNLYKDQLLNLSMKRNPCEDQLQCENLSVKHNPFNDQSENLSIKENSPCDIQRKYKELTPDDDGTIAIPYMEHVDIKACTKIDTKSTYTIQEIQQIISRISGIFNFINSTQNMIDKFTEMGLIIYEKKSKNKKKIKESKSSKPPINSESRSSRLNTESSTSMATLTSTSPCPSEATSLIPRNCTKKTPTKTSNRAIPFYNRKPWTNGLGDDKKYNNDFPITCSYDNTKVILGPNGTTISKSEWMSINWDKKPLCITRKLLRMLFGSDTLSSHNLTGRPSPAFIDFNYPPKKQLDSKIVDDIVSLVKSQTIATAKEIRMSITTKCADEAKNFRKRELKKARLQKKMLRMQPY